MMFRAQQVQRPACAAESRRVSHHGLQVVRSIWPRCSPSLTTCRPGMSHSSFARSSHVSGEKETVDDIQAAQVVTAEVVEEPSVFLEPLLRALVLGVSSGIILEVLHVATRFAGIANEVGDQLPSVLPQLVDQFSPLFVWDHVAAISCWLLFYVIEAAAVMTVLRQYPDDMRSAARAIRESVTLPKRLLPWKLSTFKNALHSFFSKRTALTAQPAVVTPPRSIEAGSSVGTLANTSTAFLDDSSAPNLPGPAVRGPTIAVRERPTVVAEGREAGGGIGVLERPRATPPMALPRTPSPEKRVLPGVKPGAWAPDAWNPSRESSLANRAKQLADRAAYLKNFWYAAALSSNLKGDKILKVEMLGRTVALYRDSNGVARALDDICPHRAAPLSDGWVRNVKGHDCVVCPYHGWAFDTEGKVREVPSSGPDAPLPKRSLVDPYPVQESGGFVYLFFGDKDLPASERPPIPTVPELSLPGWKAVYGEIEFESPHWSVFDNAIDMAHIHYLHGDSFGNDDRPVIHDMKVKRDMYHIEGSFRIHNKPVSPIWNFTAVDSVPVSAKAMLPSTSAITIQLGAGVSMITFVNTVPISATRSVNRFALIRNFAGWDGFDEWARRAMYRILGEDKVMIEQLKPERMRQEVSLEADLPQIAFRKLRQEWVDLGYAVHPEVPGKHDGSLALDKQREHSCDH